MELYFLVMGGGEERVFYHLHEFCHCVTGFEQSVNTPVFAQIFCDC